MIKERIQPNYWSLAMMRFSLAVAVLFALGNLVVADSSKNVVVRWHGQSFFEIESSAGTRLVLDPHTIEAFGRKSVVADLVLLSHLHNDHTQVEVVQNRSRTKILIGLQGTGRKHDWNPIDEQFRDVRIRAVGVYHDTRGGMERGKNTIFILEIDGLRLVHLGDLGHLLTEAQIKRIGPVDVLMIPVGGVYTLNGDDAKKVVEQLKPRQYIIPMHYGTEVYDDLLTAQEFLEDQKNVRRFPSNKLTIEVGAKLLAPVIAVLSWK
jgi:L-ascorbate metabolism protein UlaG (beta-lactamase superfamily)